MAKKNNQKNQQQKAAPKEAEKPVESQPTVEEQTPSHEEDDMQTPVDNTMTPIAPTQTPHPIDIPPIHTDIFPTNIPLPESAMADPSPLPEVTPTSSASPSRTATPATAAYDTAPGYDTPTGARTPSPRSMAIPVPASVRSTMTVDWPMDLPFTSKGHLVPFTQTFQVPSQYQTPSVVTCSTELDPHSQANSLLGLKIVVDLGYNASVDVRIYNQLDSSAPIISLFRDTGDASDFRISSKSIRQLTHNHTQPFVLISVTLSTSPTSTSTDSEEPAITETCSPAAIEALGHFLDQPSGHDVVFVFPDQKHLYADRYVLQRASRYFRTLFHARNQEALALPPPRSALADDSDAEPSKSDGERSPKVNGARSASVSSSRSRSGSERDITTTVLTPMTSVNGDVSIPPEYLQPHKYTFQRTASPLMDDNIFVMNINETSFNTFRAFLYYLYTGFISFAPLTSSFFVPTTPKTPASSSPSPSTLEQRRLEARNALVGDYMRRYRNRPVPVSPKSIYAVAKKYEIPALEAQALTRINKAVVNPYVATAELFSAFTRVNDSIRETQIARVINAWDDVVQSEDWAVAKEKGKAQPDAYFATALVEILENLPGRGGR